MHIVVVLKSGLVESIYADGDAFVDVFNLDADSPDERGETENYLDDIENCPGFQIVY